MVDTLQPGSPDPLYLHRLALLAAVAPLTLGAHLLQQLGPVQTAPVELELVAYGNTLLAASALLYLLRPIARSPRLAAWASGLALAGAVELVWAALMAWLDGRGLLVGWDWRRSASLLLAVAAVAYLMIEAFYRDARAGIVVMPLVAVAGVAQVQAVAVALRVPSEELMRLHGLFSVVCVAALGYLLLATGATRAAMLLRSASLRRAAARAGAYAAGGHVILDRAAGMVRANIWGVVVLGVACAGWEWWAHELPRDGVFLSPVEPWALAVLTAYLGHLFLLALLRPAPCRTAGWAAILFGVSVIPLAAMLIASTGAMP